MFSFDTCSSGYSFSSKFILLSAKIVIAKKWHYEPWRIYVKCLCQSTHVWEVQGGCDCSVAWGQPANGDAVTRNGSPGGP